MILEPLYILDWASGGMVPWYWRVRFVKNRTFDAASSVGAIMRQFLPREYSLMNVQSRVDFPVPVCPVIKRFRPLCISKSVEENSFVILTFITRSFDCVY